MPFAPIITYERASEYLVDYRSDQKTADFMTITYTIKDGKKEEIPAVVHVDNTARPQISKKEVNPSLHAIMNSFERHSGVPVILNTSFNVHEEPIVYTPDDAVKGFLGAQLDFLAIGHFLVPFPGGKEENRSPQ